MILPSWDARPSRGEPSSTPEERLSKTPEAAADTNEKPSAYQQRRQVSVDETPRVYTVSTVSEWEFIHDPSISNTSSYSREQDLGDSVATLRPEQQQSSSSHDVVGTDNNYSLLYHVKPPEDYANPHTAAIDANHL